MSTIGLVVVHRIGEPAAGDALADLTDSLELEGIATLASEQEVGEFLSSGGLRRDDDRAARVRAL
jgi:hypothetical protein